MPTLLHISDLHRTSGPRLHNDELLAAISSDAKRWESEGIPSPDIIVVSGDLIRGAGIDACDPDSEIEAQYAEAADLLHRLADKFVGSDHSRVVIVPGNHDVHWGRARSAMTPLATCPQRISALAWQADSNVRWDWTEQRAYQIADATRYESRLQHFRRFQADFYADLDPVPLPQGGHDLVAFEYPRLGLIVVGFASWHGNDCFCRVGEVDRSALAVSQKLLADSKARVAVAVWHHSVVGEPRANDYMDQRVIHRLIDFGFRVGLHGHQHSAGVAPFQLHLPNLTSMAVISGGSLAVGDSELPMGEPRQFNVVVLDPHSDSVTTHVRAMSPAGVFTGSPRQDFGGNTFIELRLDLTRGQPTMATPIQRLDDAMTAVANGQFKEALELVSEPIHTHTLEQRQISIEALAGLDRREALIEILSPPGNAEEAARLFSLLLGADRFAEAEVLLGSIEGLLDTPMLSEMAAMIEAKRMSREP